MLNADSVRSSVAHHLGLPSAGVTGKNIAGGQTVLSERQVKVLNRLLDNMGDEFTLGINASKYKSLAGVSKPTATRDLADLVSKSCLSQLSGGGRSTRYGIKK